MQNIKLNYREKFQPQIVDVCLRATHKNRVNFGFLGLTPSGPTDGFQRTGGTYRLRAQTYGTIPAFSWRK